MPSLSIDEVYDLIEEENQEVVNLKDKKHRDKDKKEPPKKFVLHAEE